MTKPYLYIETEEDFWEDDTDDSPSRGMSGWLTGADGAFSIPYRSDFKFGSGDYTIVQTFNCTASGGTLVASYDDYDGSTGVRFSQVSDTFSVDSGGVTVDLPSNIMDGTNQWLMVERESGVAVNAYVNDFDVVLASGSDGGSDLDNTEDLLLAYDGTTKMDGMLGLTVVFNRLLEEFEKDDLYYWIESGYTAPLEPNWLRTEATLYINPNDPVQIAHYASNETILNLAVEVPEQVYVRYDFTSADGISNPVLSYNDVRFANLNTYKQSTEQARNGAGPSAMLPVGTGESPNIAFAGTAQFDSIVIPLDELGSDWLNSDWTINFWAKTNMDGVADDIFTQGGSGVFSIRHTSTEWMGLYIESSNRAHTTTPLTNKKYSMVTVTKDGAALEMFIDGDSVDTGTYISDLTLVDDITYSPPRGGLGGPLHIWTRALDSGQIKALYNSSLQANIEISGDTVSFTEGFSTQSMNWQRT